MNRFIFQTYTDIYFINNDLDPNQEADKKCFMWFLFIYYQWFHHNKSILVSAKKVYGSLSKYSEMSQSFKIDLHREVFEFETTSIFGVAVYLYWTI